MARLRSLARSFLPFLVAVPFLLALQAATPPYRTLVLINVGVNVILAVSLNVVNGFTGQFSLGHAGFMSVGAYATAKVTLALADVQLSFLPVAASDALLFGLALLFGMLAAAAARALPSTKVQEMMRFTGMPISPATCGSKETARMAVPKRVR